MPPVPDHARARMVDVVTVNWNAGEQLNTLVRSVIEHEQQVVDRFVIVDNGSVDGSTEALPAWDRLHLDETGTNLGFGRACNRGARSGTAPYILFLNPDARLVEDAISQAVAYMEGEEGSAYAVCGIRLLDDDGQVTRPCARFPTLRSLLGQIVGLDKLLPGRAPSLLMTDFDHVHTRPVDHVQGAFYLVRRDAFERVGGFDERFFVYFEDLDLSRRLAAIGARTIYYATPAAVHSGGGTSKQVRPVARFYGMDGRILYSRKHLGGVRHQVHVVATFLVEPVATAAWHAIKYRGRTLGQLAQSWRLLFRHRRAVLSDGPRTVIAAAPRPAAIHDAPPDGRATD